MLLDGLDGFCLQGDRLRVAPCLTVQQLAERGVAAASWSALRLLPVPRGDYQVLSPGDPAQLEQALAQLADDELRRALRCSWALHRSDRRELAWRAGGGRGPAPELGAADAHQLRRLCDGHLRAQDADRPRRLFHLLTGSGQLGFVGRPQLDRFLDQYAERLDRRDGWWQVRGDRHCRIVLAHAQVQLLVDLQAGTLTGVHRRPFTERPATRAELARRLHDLAGGRRLAAVPWNGRLPLRQLPLLGPLQSWRSQLHAAHPEEQGQLALELDTPAAFWRPVRRGMPRPDHQDSQLRRRLALHSTGPLTHPGSPPQEHRLPHQGQLDHIELYRPVNPFGASIRG